MWIHTNSMGEKEIKNRNSFRSVFGIRLHFKSFFAKSDTPNDSSLFLTRSKGFTFVEILTVIAIMAILTSATILIINPGHQLQKSRDAHRKSDLKSIQSALELYRSSQGSYPNGSKVGSIPTIKNCGQSLTGDDSGACDPNATVYFKTVPPDPKTKLDYYYCHSAACGASGGGYILYSCLENTNDTDKLSSDTTPVAPLTPITSVMGCPSGSAYYGANNL